MDWPILGQRHFDNGLHRFSIWISNAYEPSRSDHPAAAVGSQPLESLPCLSVLAHPATALGSKGSRSPSSYSEANIPTILKPTRTAKARAHSAAVNVLSYVMEEQRFRRPTFW
ncbi:hypothetical protein RvY_09003-2 [Ramazzottius varieornatus]|uniref:Uncharacterized protein n=1 Tax=Ramazzottius varieornatus TaxID=947166 RepID=A0A1D1V7Y7_RAMVA|nr:hypothetical protein RvY_09003-2 [Ramazzottius varieornatus]